jgi:hypothetical protein
MARNLPSRTVVGETSAALAGLGNFVGTIYPGRRSPTRFALGYYLSGFQPCESACISVNQRFNPSRFNVFALKTVRVFCVVRGLIREAACGISFQRLECRRESDFHYRCAAHLLTPLV